MKKRCTGYSTLMKLLESQIMATIEFDDNDFTVVGHEYDYGDPVGEYRIIRYSTGYYGLQRLTINMDLEDENPFIWETMCICPELESVLNKEYNWKLSNGKLIMEDILHHIDNSSKLYNNELMEVHLQLNYSEDEELNEELIEVMKTEDGKKLLDRVSQSMEIYETYYTDYLSKQEKHNKILLIILIIITITVICVCFSIHIPIVVS